MEKQIPRGLKSIRDRQNESQIKAG